MSKLEINIDSTSLGSSSCWLNFVRTTIGEVDQIDVGAYTNVQKAATIYGVAVHKFFDVMFKTNGHYPAARDAANKAFNVPKINKDKAPWLSDPHHFISSCFNAWERQVVEENSFELLSISQDCWWCKGSGKDFFHPEAPDAPCNKCNGTGKVTGPATEITFRIFYYEDDFCKIFLCGTIDSVGKIKGGCYAIRDWKTTSSWHSDYMEQYELSRQLRVYTLACKIMSQLHPDSVLGKVGATNMGAFIDAIHIKQKPNDNTYERSDVFQLTKELPAFEQQLKEFCDELSTRLRTKNIPKQGILNGTCITPYGKCRFWNVCRVNDNVAQTLLKRDFQRRKYDPLNFQND